MFSWFKSKPPAPVRNEWEHTELVEVIHQLQPGVPVTVLDHFYCSVTLEEIRIAAKESWLPWDAINWDCNHQARSLIDALCRRFHKERLANAVPAVGVRDVLWLATRERHRLVWYVDAAGYLQYFNPGNGLTIPDLFAVAREPGVFLVI